jgi:hypothetical protein
VISGDWETARLVCARGRTQSLRRCHRWVERCRGRPCSTSPPICPPPLRHTIEEYPLCELCLGQAPGASDVSTRVSQSAPWDRPFGSSGLKPPPKKKPRDGGAKQETEQPARQCPRGRADSPSTDYGVLGANRAPHRFSCAKAAYISASRCRIIAFVASSNIGGLPRGGRSDAGVAVVTRRPARRPSADCPPCARHNRATRRGRGGSCVPKSARRP